MKQRDIIGWWLFGFMVILLGYLLATSDEAGEELDRANEDLTRLQGLVEQQDREKEVLAREVDRLSEALAEAQGRLDVLQSVVSELDTRVEPEALP